MEVKIVKVHADRTKDGRLIYRGKRKRHRGRTTRDKILAVTFAFAIMASVVTLVCFAKPESAPAPVETAKTAELVEHIASVIIPTQAPVPAKVELKEDPALDEEMIEILALVIYQEAGGDACSDETRRMVGEVAMNRVEDSRFPDTLKEVLLQKSQYGRLHWTGLVWPKRANLEAEAHAVKRAYETARIVLSEDEQLLPDDVIFQAEFPQGAETVVKADGLYFCR